MSFLKKKRFKFNVDLEVTDLSDVPLVNAVLFAKVRLLDGGSYINSTARVEVVNHRVCWERRFEFPCRIASNPNTGVLESCLCRVSVRKELKGGKAYQKLGFVDVNLSEFADSGVAGQSRSYLLDGYGSGHQREDNSRLRITVVMCHQSADPCFKVPRQMTRDQQVYLNPADRKAPSASSDTPVPSPQSSLVDDNQSTHSSSSGFESISHPLPPLRHVGNKAAAPSLIIDDAAGCSLSAADSPPGRRRRDSQTSVHSSSQGSGYASAPPSAGIVNHQQHQQLQQSGAPTPTLARPSSSSSRAPHSRQNSQEALAPVVITTTTSVVIHPRRASQDQTRPAGKVPAPHPGGRVEATRVDAEQFIDSMLRETIGEFESAAADRSDEGLALYVSSDGQAVVAANSLSQTGAFVRVQIAEPQSG